MHLNHPDISKALVTADQIAEKILELAGHIDSYYQDKDPLLVGVLKGAVPFMADLSRSMQLSTSQDWMAVSS